MIHQSNSHIYYNIHVQEIGHLIRINKEDAKKRENLMFFETILKNYGINQNFDYSYSKKAYLLENESEAVEN